MTHLEDMDARINLPRLRDALAVAAQHLTAREKATVRFALTGGYVSPDCRVRRPLSRARFSTAGRETIRSLVAKGILEHTPTKHWRARYTLSADLLTHFNDQYVSGDI
jgi:hypothetical protein